MAMDDDWEAEYERDRLAMQQGNQSAMSGGGGGSGGNDRGGGSMNGRGPQQQENTSSSYGCGGGNDRGPTASNNGVSDEEAYAQYTGNAHKEQPPPAYNDNGGGGRGNNNSNADDMPSTAGMSIEDAYYAGGNHVPIDQSGGAAAFGASSTDADPGPAGNPRAWPRPGDSEDGRFLLPYVAIPDQHKKMFGDKIGRLLYWAGDITVYFKGWFTSAEHVMVAFCTPYGIWIGDPATGALIICRMYRVIRDLLSFQDQGLILVSRQASDPDVVLKVGKKEERQAGDAEDRDRLQLVIRQIARSHGTPMASVRALNKEAEKTFRSGITYINPKECVYNFDEDPRTGLALVEVPGKFTAFYSQLVPKIMHYFGGVFHIQKDWKGTVQKERRGCWITATCVFLSMPDGPQNDGRDIRRCIGLEYISLVLSAKGGELGIRVNGGPKQPDLAIIFDSIDVKEKVIHILREAYYLRTRRSLNVQAGNSVAVEMNVEKEKDLKVQLFVMKTRTDLYGLLREPTGKK